MDSVCSCGEWRSYSSWLFSSIFFFRAIHFLICFSFPFTTQSPKDASNFSFLLFFFSCSRSYKILRLHILLITFSIICHIFPDIFFTFLYFRWISLPDSSFISNIYPVAYFLLLYSQHFFSFCLCLPRRLALGGGIRENMPEVSIFPIFTLRQFCVWACFVLKLYWAFLVVLYFPLLSSVFWENNLMQGARQSAWSSAIWKTLYDNSS